LIEPAGETIDLRAQLGDAVFVAELHLRLAADQPGQHVVAEGEIGRRSDAPGRHDDQRADHDPEGDRADAHLPAGMHQGVVRALTLRRRDRRRRRPQMGVRGGMTRRLIQIRPVRH
jgi:hypothetical protein